MGPTGLLINAPRPNLLRFMPALNVTRAEIDQMISMLDEVMTVEIASRKQAVPA